MRNTLIFLAVLALVALGLWLLAESALWRELGQAAMRRQREVQDALAGALRALRAGNPGALAGLLSLCFFYGLFHAAGPGHGKVLIASYGIGRQVPLPRLLAVALASSLGQAVVAIILVYGSLCLLDWGFRDLTAFGEQKLALVSSILLACVGLWLLARGLRHGFGLRRAPAAAHHHKHGHDHCHDHDHHHHLPSASEIAKAHSLGETLAMIGIVAIRPCTGALLVLLLTWQSGLILAGLLGVFAMAIGTASVVLLVALLAGGGGGALVRSLDSRATRVALPVLEILAGAGIIAAALIGYFAIRPY